MRRLIWITLVLAGLYAGYWALASRGVLAAVRGEVARLEAAGLAEVGEVTLAGFPSRFDLTFRDAAVVDRSGFYGWSAPFFQVFALSYRPNHLIAVWPEAQEVLVAGLPLSVTSEDMRASAVFAGTGLALDHMALVGKTLTLTPPEGPGLALAEARLASRTAPGVDNGHDLGLALFRIAPDPALARALDPEGRLPAEIDWLRLDAVLAFDRPLDRAALAGGAPRLTGVELREASLRWGPLSLEGEGRLAPDTAGLLEGRVDLVARDWRELVRLATLAGLVRPEIAPTFEAALEQIDAADGDAQALRVPLTWKNGRTSLGPIPLGPAPRF